MSVMRSVLLKGSESAWLRERATRTAFVRRAVSRFMPGETFDDMLGAARVMSGLGVGSVFTRLGEGVRDRAEAGAVLAHYLECLSRLRQMGVDCEPSIKPTQLGLDIDRDLALGHLQTLAAHAHECGTYLWVDMEQSSYVDVTLDFMRRLRETYPRVGVCLQAYLYRTREDLVDLMGRGVGIRLVKGAYNEPRAIAYRRKADIDAAFARMMKVLLTDGHYPAFATHDPAMIDLARQWTTERQISRDRFEFQMLHGIRRDLQRMLSKEGYRMRVYVPFGREWFPYVMRRLGERPANVVSVLRSLAGERR